MSCGEVTTADFKEYFDREFEYGSDATRDKDIERAAAETAAVFNPDLYPTEDVCRLARLYLTAHFLSADTQASDTGGAPALHHSSRSVGSVSETLSVPEWMLGEDFAFFVTTYWGQKFLQLSRPYLGGGVYSVPGGTNP